MTTETSVIILSLSPSIQSIIKLFNLAVLDVTKNRLELLPDGFSKLASLSDLHLSENCLQELPADLGDLTNLTLLKLDVNQIMALPDSIGRYGNSSSAIAVIVL